MIPFAPPPWAPDTLPYRPFEIVTPMTIVVWAIMAPILSIYYAWKETRSGRSGPVGPEVTSD